MRSCSSPTSVTDMNTSQAINGEIRRGDWVIAAPSDEYGYLLGIVMEIEKLGTPEHETENATDDLHVDFSAFDYPQERIAEIEANFSDLYGEKKWFEDLALDDVIMAPDDLIRITELGDDEITRTGNSIENCRALCNRFLSNIQTHTGMGEANTYADGSLNHNADVYNQSIAEASMKPKTLSEKLKEATNKANALDSHEKNTKSHYREER